MTQIPDHIPSAQDIIDFLNRKGGTAKKSDIAKDFKIKGHDRIGLKQRLKDMVARGDLISGKHRTLQLPQSLPPIATMIVSHIDVDGEFLVKPEKWEYDTEPPEVLLHIPSGKQGMLIEEGDALVCHTERLSNGDYLAKPIRKIERFVDEIIGFYERKKKYGIVTPTDRRNRKTYQIPRGHDLEARDGDLVQVAVENKAAKISKILGHQDDADIISLIAIHSHEIPVAFKQETIDETKNIAVPDLGDRTDLREIPLVTIDGADARDFDDAVYAEADPSPQNEGGWKLIVAIADVAHYVRKGSSLDAEAYERGNSVYFPDRVVPMLPEKLSNGLCSLVPNEVRACMAVKMTIDKNGQLIKQKVIRGLMKSAARLTYDQVQMALDGNPDETTKPIKETLLEPLYGAFKTLEKARKKRGTIELEMPERNVTIKDGRITEITLRHRYDSHKLIEEFMILANVAVAKALEKIEQPLIYRVHSQPDAARLESTRTFLKEMGYSLAPGQVKPVQFDQVLKQAAGREEEPLIHEMVLRSMSQAIYSPDNDGHFGLSLESYAHFTSPIRRYADLIVHRALIKAFKLGEDGLSDYEAKKLMQISEHISDTERTAALAERDATDRYVALYLAEQGAAEFAGRISGVTRFGLFIRLNETGADGLVPIRSLPNDFYIHDEARHALVGRRTRRTYRLCAPVFVRLVESSIETGSTIFEIVGTEGADIAPQPRRDGPPRDNKRNKPSKKRKNRSKKYKAARKK